MKKNEILKIYGTEYKKMTKELLYEANLKELIKKGSRIGIKPNLMSCIPADFGATTHPEVVEGIIEYLRENDFDDIVIMEGSWVGDKTEESFEICGFNELSQRLNVPLFDMQKDAFYESSPIEFPKLKGYEKYFEKAKDSLNSDSIKVKICKSVKNIDFLINVPILKGHCQTNVTCALKNLKGLIPNSEKRRFHSLGLHAPIAILNASIHQDFVVVDHICGDLDSEGGGNPYYSNCVMAAIDPVLLDSYCCRLLQFELDNVPYIKLAAALSVGSCDLSKLDIKIINDDGLHNTEQLPITHKIFKLKDFTEDVDTCSACYESLMEALLRLSEEGLLENFNEKILIGQGNRGKDGLYGIGNCTKDFKYSIKGCPPNPEDIYEGIKGWSQMLQQ